MPRRRTLIVFAKAPRFGAVKSRLGRDIGRLEAWRFHRRQLDALLRRLGRDRRWRTVLAITPDGAAVRLGRAPRKIGQGRGNLGQRMARAFARAFTARPGPMVLIGTDIPGVRPGHIADAFRRLEAFDAVFGPAADGGYWLVGFRQPPDARVFARVRWSGPFALSDTLANLKGWTIAPHLETLADVDDGLSWGRAWRALTSGVP